MTNRSASYKIEKGVENNYENEENEGGSRV